MTNVGIAFEILDEDKSAPVGWSKESGHLVLDVKMDFTRKARWVLDGHQSTDTIGSIYAGVISRDSVRIALTYAALNGIDVLAVYIQNTYLQDDNLWVEVFSAVEVWIRDMGYTKRHEIVSPN